MLYALVAMIGSGLLSSRLLTVAQMAAALTLLAGIEAWSIAVINSENLLSAFVRFLALQAAGETAFLIGILWLFRAKRVRHPTAYESR